MDKLAEMFTAQHSLVDRYVKLGRMPKFPLKLSEKTSHKTLKDLGGYFIEELSELYEEYVSMYQYSDLNMPEEVESSTIAFKEEMADCFHFLLEILMYAGFTQEGIQNWIDSYSPLQHILNPESGDNRLEELFTWAKQANDSELGNKPDPACYRVSLNGFSSSIGLSTLSDNSQFLWTLSHKLKQTERKLNSSKPWKSSESEADYKAYEHGMFEVFLLFIRMAKYCGFTADLLHKEYMKKNQKNFDRIKNGY